MSASIVNVSVKRNLKRKHSYDCPSKYPHPYEDKERVRDRFSWTRFLKFSIALNLLNLLSLKCNVHVHYPDKQQVSHVILLIPRLCKQTVTFTFWLVIAPLRLSYSKTDAIWLKRISQNYNPYYWRKNQSCNRAESKRRLLILLQLLQLPLIPLVALLIVPARSAFTKIRVGRTSSARSTTIFKTRGWQIKCYRMMPLKSLSNAWGFVNNINLPIFLRPIILNLYVKAFGCDLAEAEIEDLTYYKNLGEFFRRSLKSGVRPIDGHSPIVSPVDGTILHFGEVHGGTIEQVKGVSYSITQFLGPPTWTDDQNTLYDCEAYTKKILYNENGTSLFHCVIYLAPGDYHRFHSPVEWNAHFRRHFAGELLSVNPKIASLVNGLFSLNERAVYTGSWKHGFFSFTAVGATNVGSIKVYEDTDLQTNVRRQPKGLYKDKFFEEPLLFKKGDNIGEFNLGSTVILVFEAPSNFSFSLQHGNRVKVGQSIVQHLPAHPECCSL